MKYLFLLVIFGVLVAFPAGALAQKTSGVSVEGQIVCCADCWA